MPDSPLFTAPTSRVLAATVGVLLCAIVVTAALPAYLPFNQANNIALPIILFPVTWLALFLWVLFARNMVRAWLALVVLAVIHAGIIATGLLG